MSNILMQCGCVAQGKDKDGKWHCLVHWPDPKASTPAAVPNLTGRQSRCAYCKRAEPSALSLPFFEYQPTKEYDRHYCGCRGWD